MFTYDTTFDILSIIIIITGIIIIINLRTTSLNKHDIVYISYPSLIHFSSLLQGEGGRWRGERREEELKREEGGGT